LTRPLLVGESNPHGPPSAALYPYPIGSSGWHLRQILGLTPREYLDAFDRVNLCGSSWSLAEARSWASRLREHAPPGFRWILLGARVCRAFEVPYRRCGLVAIDGGTGLTIGHPSRRNRIWNDPAEREQASRAVSMFLKEDRIDELA